MTKWSPNYTAFEMFNSVSENWNFNNPTAQVILEVDWDDRILMMYDLLQYRRAWPFASPVYTGTPPPANGQALPIPTLRATSCSIRPDRAKYTAIAPDEETMHYEHSAFLEVGYEALQGVVYEPIGTGHPGCNDFLYVEEEFEPQVEFLTTDIRLFKWASDQAAVKRGLEQAVVIRSAALTRTVHGYSTIPVGLLGGLDPDAEWIGKTHCYDFTSDVNLNYYEKDTLLCTNPIITPSFYNLGTDSSNFGYSFSVKLKMLYRPNGWNKWYRPKTAGAVDASGYEGVVFAEDKTVDFEPFKSVNMIEFMFNDNAAPTRAQYCASGVLQCGSTYP